MSPHQILLVLAARWRAALLVLTVLVLGVLVLSVMQPRQYLATAAVMIDARSDDPVAAPNASGGPATAGYMGTQVDLIQSERVAARVMRILGLDGSASWHAQWMRSTQGRGSYPAWLSEQLLKKLEVKPSRESNVVNIGYLSSDPAFSAAAANAFVKAYIDTNLDLKVEPARQYNAFFDERARQLRGQLESAQTRLSAYQKSKGIIATDGRLDVENARLAELSSQVVTLEGVAAESMGRRGQAGADSQEVLNNVTVGALTAALSAQEGQLSELRQRLGTRNPQVVQLSANIAQARLQLAAETRRVSNSLGVNTSVDRARLASAQAALAAQRERVLQTRGQRDEASVLVRDVDSAQKAYDAALARVTQTSLESQNTFTNVSIIKTATPPPFASSPRVLLNTAVAFVVGCMLALGVVLVRESMDRRLRVDADVTDLLRLPLLARIPDAGAPPSGGPARPVSLLARLSFQLPRAVS